MPDFAREFTDLCERIASAERRIEVQHEKLNRHAEGSDQALYARALVGVLERSLALMYRRRDRLERELCIYRRAQTRRRMPAGLAPAGTGAVVSARSREDARVRREVTWAAGKSRLSEQVPSVATPGHTWSKPARM
jgi:hypothetical protein